MTDNQTGGFDVIGDVHGCVMLARRFDQNKGGPLVAYLWSGETALTSTNLVATPT